MINRQFRNYSLLITLATLPLLGCTSIQWTDSSGTTHNFGLVAARFAEGAASSRIDRYSFGFDVSLKGLETGATLGLQHSTSDIPQVVVVQHPAALPDYVASYLRRQDVESPHRDVTWHWLWFKEKLSSRATYFDSQTIGLGVKIRDKRGRFTLGYAAGHGYTGEALDENIVQIRTYNDKSRKHWELVLWKFPTSTLQN